MALQLLSTVGLLASGAAAAGHIFPGCQTGLLSENTVCDTKASVTDRAKALVAALSIEEKIALTGSTSPGVPRLGIPSYEWWRKFFDLARWTPTHTNAINHRGGSSWRSFVARSNLQQVRRLFLCHLVPSAYPDGGGL